MGGSYYSSVRPDTVHTREHKTSLVLADIMAQMAQPCITANIVFNKFSEKLREKRWDRGVMFQLDQRTVTWSSTLSLHNCNSISRQTKPVKTFKFSFCSVESVLFSSCSVGAESCWHHCHNRHKDHLVITELWGQRWWGEALLRKGSSLLKLVFTRQCVHSTLPVVVIYFPRVIAPSPIKKTHRRLIIWYKAPVQR